VHEIGRSRATSSPKGAPLSGSQAEGLATLPGRRRYRAPKSQDSEGKHGACKGARVA